MSTTPAITVVIVSWNGRDLLEACLPSVVPQLAAEDAIVVVDNGSRDDTCAWLGATYPGITLVPLDTNTGFAAGCNAGLARAITPWILTLNNDARLGPGAVDALRSAACQADSDVGALQPLLVLDEHAEGPMRVNSTGIALSRHGGARDRDLGSLRSEVHHEEGSEVFGPTAGAALYRRSMLDALRLTTGVFDASFFMYFEDVDLAWRARLAGWRTTCVLRAVVHHRLQASSAKKGRAFIIAHCARNRLRCVLKNASLWTLLRGSRRTAGELAWLMRHEGGQALSRWLPALSSGLRQRWAVGGLATNSRRATERRWMGIGQVRPPGVKDSR